MLHREHVCIEIGNPLLALLRDSKIAQSISDIRPDRLPEKIWIISSQICDSIVLQFSVHSRLAKLVKQRSLLSQVVDVRDLPDQIRSTYQARKIVSRLVLLILRNREARVFYVGFDRRGVEADEGFRGTFAYEQFGPSDMVRCQRCVGRSLREGHLITGKVGDVGAIPITSTDSTHVPDVMT